MRSNRETCALRAAAPATGALKFADGVGDGDQGAQRTKGGVPWGRPWFWATIAWLLAPPKNAKTHRIWPRNSI